MNRDSTHRPPSRTRLLAGLALALLAPTGAALAEEGYRSPGDMTIDERTAMMQLVGQYNNCLYKEGLARVEQFADIRQAADAAMEACEATANQLRETIDGFRFEPGFAEQFVHHTQSRAVRSLMPELAIRKSGS